MNNKGFTVVEVISSFTLISVIAFTLLQIIFVLKNVYDKTDIKTKLINNQNIISENINSNINSKVVISVTRCGDYCLDFVYSDGTSQILEMDYQNGIISFGGNANKIVEGSKMKIPVIDLLYAMVPYPNKNDAILNIKVPITVNNIDGDFGLNIVFQFNRNNTNVNLE